MRRGEAASEEPIGLSVPEVEGIPFGANLRDVLIECAEAVSRSEWDVANRLTALLSKKVSVNGDSLERVIAYFTDSLAVRVAMLVGQGRQPTYPTAEEIQAAYLTLNKITPFIRFAHLTANQAILEALDGSASMHIVDFEIMQGVQWPPLMQALAERCGGRPRLRITGTGSDMVMVEQTGNRLVRFASTLGLPFEFHALHVNSIEEITSIMLDTRPGEALAINCVLQLHRLLKKEERDTLKSFLATIHSLEPKVVALAEREASYNQLVFVERFKEALQHYSALFESLEATLPPTSSDRIMVERFWLRQEIMNVIAFEGSSRTRHENFHTWSDILKGAGFHTIQLSTFARSQARLLLRLHYPSEGYQLLEEDDCLLLGWHDTPLFAVSSWR